MSDLSKATARGPHWEAADRALRKLAIFNSLPEHSQNAYRLTVSEAIEAAATSELIFMIIAAALAKAEERR